MLPSPEWTKRYCGCFLDTFSALVPLSCRAVLPPFPPDPLPSPISLSLGAEEELSLGALCVVPQEESEEVFVRSMQLHFTLFPSDGGEGSVVKYQEAATPAKYKAFQPDSRVTMLPPPSYLLPIQNPWP